MIGASLKEIKERCILEGRAPVTQIIRTPSLKSDGWLHTGFRVTCNACGAEIECAALYVPMDNDDAFVEAMTLWPDANIVNPPSNTW